MSFRSKHQPVPNPPDSRRYATRYEPSRRDACLAWREQADLKSEAIVATEISVDEARRHFAFLVDISHTGASVALDELPCQDEGVWLRLEGEETSEWTEARVVGMTITTRGPHLIRLAFQAPCPFETLRAAICG